MKAIKKFLICILSLCLLGIAFVIIGYKSITYNTYLDSTKLTLSANRFILYDHRGETVNLPTAKIKQSVSFEELPQYTKQAFIDIEDRRFYKHNGFDFRGVIRAIYRNVRAKSLKEGASTIPQQLIKNSHLTQEKTFKRKIREWKLTKELERKYQKDEILTCYLNTIYFGHSCFGITAAAEFYFGKQPSELSLAESAMLAGMVKSPNNYSPFRNPENCLKRRNIVLHVMCELGDISIQEKQAAVNVPLPMMNEESKYFTSYAHSVFDEINHITDTLDLTISGNVEVYTYLDQPLQKHLETLSKQIDDCDKTFLVLSHKNGGFKACVTNTGNIRRQPGSLLKPLLVYTPAMEENLLSPATPILDEPINYAGYTPKNHDGTYHGYISARECIEKSLNIPAVKVLSSLGIDKGVHYLEKLGLPVLEEDKSLALSLGGMKHGYTLNELLSAYSVFPNNGKKIECGFIDKIKINNTIVYQKSTQKQRAFSEESAYLMTDMLKSTARQGTAKKLRECPFEIAAKTGTVGTQRGNTDAYALSYTTKDCVGVWLGNADNRTINYSGGGAPCNYLKSINEFLHDEYRAHGEKIQGFTKPVNISRVALDRTSYYDTHTILLADDNSPKEYQFSELFKSQAIPLTKSTSFTSPSIPQPIVKRENDQVIIQFDGSFPKYYSYKIERYDYVTHTTLYQGGFIESFVDRIAPNKKYVYKITPIFNKNIGKPIELPIINTSTSPSTLMEDKRILDTDWWKN